MAKDSQFVGQIADIEKDFPQWYTDVVLKTKMVDYGPVKGTMVIRPVRVCDLGKHSARDGQALQGAGRGERVFSAADSHELFHEGSRACGGLCAPKLP